MDDSDPGVRLPPESPRRSSEGELLLEWRLLLVFPVGVPRLRPLLLLEGDGLFKVLHVMLVLEADIGDSVCA